MKNFLFLLIFIISIGFSNCKRSNDPSPPITDAPRNVAITVPKPNLEKQPKTVEAPPDFNILTVSGNMDARIKWAVALKAANVISLPFSHTVVAVGERIAGTNTFKLYELVNGVTDPNKPWKGAGAYYLALSITEENDGNQWIVAGGAGVLRAPTKHRFNGESFTVNWNRFMKNPF